MLFFNPSVRDTNSDLVQEIEQRFGMAPTPIVVLVSLLLGFLLFLVGGIVVINKPPSNPDQPVIEDSVGSEPITQ